MTKLMVFCKSPLNRSSKKLVSASSNRPLNSSRKLHICTTPHTQQTLEYWGAQNPSTIGLCQRSKAQGCLRKLHAMILDLSRYVTSHPGLLSLAIQKTVTPCGWGVKAGMVRVWVAGKTVWSRCYTRAIRKRFRDDILACSPLKTGEIVPIYSKSSECTKVYHNDCCHSPSVMLQLLADIQPRS